MGAPANPQRVNGSDLVAALHLSQQAPGILGHGSTKATASANSSGDTAEEYDQLEQLFFSCLRTGDDKSAHICLDRLSRRFGPSNERVMGLQGLYQEATAKDDTALEKCLEAYNKTIQENPVNVPILKRRVALLRSLHRSSDAIAALIELLDAIPTDAEAWCELADLYQAQGLGAQAIFSLEEALLIAPNAWNIHSRLGEVLYINSSTPEGARLAGKSVQHFCRSIELCDDYLRGFYGLALASSRLLEMGSETPSDPSTLSKQTVGRLYEFALKRLRNIVQSRSIDDQHWASCRSELIAAQALLNRFDQKS